MGTHVLQLQAQWNTANEEWDAFSLKVEESTNAYEEASARVQDATSASTMLMDDDISAKDLQMDLKDLDDDDCKHMLAKIKRTATKLENRIKNATAATPQDKEVVFSKLPTTNNTFRLGVAAGNENWPEPSAKQGAKVDAKKRIECPRQKLRKAKKEFDGEDIYGEGDRSRSDRGDVDEEDDLSEKEVIPVVKPHEAETGQHFPSS